MNAEILCIGTEVLIGDIVNTNAAYISKKLSEAGVSVYYHSVCGDNKHRLQKSINHALSRSDIIITTGGLGPTYDDITKEIIAEELGIELVLNNEILHHLEEYFAKSGRTMTENNIKQAYVPRDSHIFRNMFGTADGICVTHNEKMIIMLPGPPREMIPMLDNQVIPYLSLKTDHVLVSSNINIFGMGESSVENALADIMKTSTNPTIAPYVGGGEVRLRITASAKNEADARKLISPIAQKVKQTLGDVVYGIDADSIESVLVEKLTEKGKTVSFAESCTGGLISKRITDVPGASKVYGFGFCTYANEAKMKILGVKAETLEKYGAVSSQTACEMAEGARLVSGSDIAISVTGIAGPTGGSAEKPVGLVYMGISTAKETKFRKLLLAQHPGHDRDYVRTLTANHAFKTAIDECSFM